MSNVWLMQWTTFCWLHNEGVNESNEWFDGVVDIFSNTKC